MEQLTPNVFVETEYRGCNVGFVTTSEGIVMIDTPQRPSDAVHWREQIAGRGAVSYLINTEPHFDHVTGNFFFPQATIISHQGTREALFSSFGTIEQLRERTRALDPEGLSLMENYEPNMPTITFNERMTLHCGEHTFELLHLPGHTPSETAVYVREEKVVFTGDNVVGRVQPVMGYSSPLEWIESLKKLQELDIDHIVPGHGPVCPKDWLSEFTAFLQEWIGAVRDAKRQGWTKEEAQARISFLDRYPAAPGLEARAQEMQRGGVARLYDVLSSP